MVQWISVTVMSSLFCFTTCVIVRPDPPQDSYRKNSSPRRLLSSNEDCTVDTCCKPYTEITGHADGTRIFGFSLTNPLPNQTCSWKIIPKIQDPPQMFNIVFLTFNIQSGIDKVTIFDDKGGKIATLDSDYNAPFIMSPTPAISFFLIRFNTIPDLNDGNNIQHIRTNRAYKVGFQVTYLQSNDKCYQNCGRGGSELCQHGICNCNSDWIKAGCSIHAPKLTNNSPLKINNLCVGCFNYTHFEVKAKTHVVVDLIDIGHPDSEPFLQIFRGNIKNSMLAQDVPIAQDTLHWYYDNSDLHYVRKELEPGTYYIRVENHRDRAKEPLNAKLTVRWETEPSIACVANCFGNGVCANKCKPGNRYCEGVCTCRPGFSGEFCNFRSISVDFGKSINSTLRIGEWAFYSVKIAPEFADRHLLHVAMSSYTPRARGILLLRKNKQPELDNRYLPTFDAFKTDFGDEKGFELLQGHQQNIIVERNNLTAGTYYIGVFNIWGHTGMSTVSYDTLDYELYVDLYAAGVPCPRDHGDFCSGFPCDFNIGACSCPKNSVGSACGFASDKMLNIIDTKSKILKAGRTHYYWIDVTAADLARGRNLKVTFRQLSTTGKPLLLARKGEIPYRSNYLFYDDHDLISHFYGDYEHVIILDREELTMGIWYFGVINSVEDSGDVNYKIYYEYNDEFACPSGRNTHKTCSSHGSCDKALGRCNCANGYTADDCSADGVFPLNRGGRSDTPDITASPSSFPPIGVDDWGYWSAPIGCEGVKFFVEMNHGNLPSGAKPLLVMRRSVLPLQMEGAFDYYDYYDGGEKNKLFQRIQIRDCNDIKCEIHGGMGGRGTEYATGSPEPGVYFIGIYNEPNAYGPLENYTVRFWIEGQCTLGCAQGFLDDPKIEGADCEYICPGMFTNNVYSNSPVRVGKPCNGHGSCKYDMDVHNPESKAICNCDANYWGESCNITCPGVGKEGNGSIRVCSGHGECNYGDSHPFCNCEQFFYGDDCGISCPGLITHANNKLKVCNGNGKCMTQASETGIKLSCQCLKGYAGEDCSDSCQQYCNFNGRCEKIFIEETGKEGLKCVCDDGYMGQECQLKCPGQSRPCSGNGVCILSENGTLTECKCFGTFSSQKDCSGDLIDPHKARLVRVKSTKLIIVVIILALLLVCCAAAMYYLWNLSNMRKMEIEQLQTPLVGDHYDDDDEGSTVEMETIEKEVTNKTKSIET